MKSFLAWLDHRTGCKKIVHGALYENVPGGGRWRYVWGSTLTFALIIIFLWPIGIRQSRTPLFRHCPRCKTDCRGSFRWAGLGTRGNEPQAVSQNSLRVEVLRPGQKRWASG